MNRFKLERDHIFSTQAMSLRASLLQGVLGSSGNPRSNLLLIEEMGSEDEDEACVSPSLH